MGGSQPETVTKSLALSSQPELQLCCSVVLQEEVSFEFLYKCFHAIALSHTDYPTLYGGLPKDSPKPIKGNWILSVQFFRDAPYIVGLTAKLNAPGAEDCSNAAEEQSVSSLLDKAAETKDYSSLDIFMKLKWVEKSTDPAGTEMAAKKWQSLKEQQV